MREFLLEKSSELKAILQEIENQYDEVKAKVSTLDKLENDIKHEIEFDRLSAVDMTKKYKELQATLRLRRIYKENVEYFIEFRKTMNINGIKKSTKNVNNMQKQILKRKYRTRVEQDVRQEILNEIKKLEG